MIITAADAAMESVLQSSLKQYAVCGYSPLIYSINNSLKTVPGIPFYPDAIKSLDYSNNKLKRRGVSPYKPKVIRHAIETNLNEGMIAWLDADAFPIRRFDEIETMVDFDIGVTLRQYSEKCEIEEYREWYNYINAGVIFIRPSPAVLKFVDEWIIQTEESEFNSDQHALNKIFLRHNDMKQRNVVFSCGDIRVRLFETEVYNWHYFPYEPFHETKIVHWKEFKNCVEYALNWKDRDWSTFMSK